MLLYCASPSSSSPPFTVIVFVPIPSMFAPLFFKNVRTDVTSGSSTQFFSIVVPSANKAVVTTPSVPVTVSFENSIVQPLKFSFCHKSCP